MQNNTIQHVRQLQPAGMQSFASRNLGLLNAIENTLDALDADTGLLQALQQGYEEIHARLQSHDACIDQDGSFLNTLEKASDVCSRIYRDACQRHHSACCDPLLTPDDGVSDAYSGFIEAVRNLHDAIEALREWVATHDAVLEPTTGQTYASAEDLFAALLNSPQ